MHPLLQRIKQNPEIEKELFKSISASDYQTKAISFVNPFSYMLLRKNKPHYQSIDHFYSDGIMSSVIFSALFLKSVPRISFDHGSFAKTFFNIAEQSNLPIFFVGSKEEQITGAIKQFKQAYPKLNICGYHNGYFNDDQKVIDKIKASGAQYVICGLGTPKQEVFAGKVKEKLSGQVKQIYTCGGFLHQSEQSVDYYPVLINKLNLRWLYRALTVPYVMKRLLTHYPFFIFYALWDRLK